MSESANSVVPTVENNLKQEDKPAANESNATPAASGRRKRTSRELTDTLVISTPDGSSRRLTRSQVRGTPAPTPAKKAALVEPKASAANGSPAKRRGRPPKGQSIVEDKPLAETKAEDEESKTDNESENEGVKETVAQKVEAVAPKVEKKQEVSKPVEVESTETVDGASSSKDAKVIAAEEPKVEEKPVEIKENSQPAETKLVVESNAEKPTEVGTSEEAVNNHEA